jgi:hypothetical protein
MPPVVRQTQDIDVEVFPRPIQRRQFAVMRVFYRDIVTRVVTNEPNVFFALFPGMNGKV